MTQTTLPPPEEIPNGLTLCHTCDKVVPRVIVCLYCGANLKEVER